MRDLNGLRSRKLMRRFLLCEDNSLEINSIKARVNDAIQLINVGKNGLTTFMTLTGIDCPDRGCPDCGSQVRAYPKDANGERIPMLSNGMNNRFVSGHRFALPHSAP